MDRIFHYLVRSKDTKAKQQRRIDNSYRSWYPKYRNRFLLTALQLTSTLSGPYHPGSGVHFIHDTSPFDSITDCEEVCEEFPNGRNLDNSSRKHKGEGNGSHAQSLDYKKYIILYIFEIVVLAFLQLSFCFDNVSSLTFIAKPILQIRPLKSCKVMVVKKAIHCLCLTLELEFHTN